MRSSNASNDKEERQLPEYKEAAQGAKSWEEQREMLKQALQSHSPDLSQESISPVNDVEEHDGKLAFLLNAWDWFDAVFKTGFFRNDASSFVNVFAQYDLRQCAVDENLYVVLWGDNEQSEEFEYPLSAGEQAMLQRAMEDYLPRQMGLTLHEYAEDFQEAQSFRQELRGMDQTMLS